MLNLNKSKKNDLKIVIALIVIIQLVLGMQGFDVCDDGFVLTFYQQIYNDPSCVEYSFSYWLSGIVGGVWYKIFPEGGVLWFRFFTVIINTLIFYFSYRVFKLVLPKRITILGLLMVLFVNDFGFLTYYHNHLTALLLVVSVLFLMKGLIEGKKFLIFISGVIIAINVFSRIPNITLFVFVLAIPFYLISKGCTYKYIIRLVLNYILGIAVGFSLVWFLLGRLNQTEIMIDAIYSLFSLGKNQGNSHNLVTLFHTYKYNYIKLFSIFCELIILIFLFLTGYEFFKKKKIVLIFILLAAFLFAFRWFLIGHIYSIYSIGYLGVLLILLTKSIKIEVKTLAFLGLLMLTFLPLGSDGGIVSSGYMCLWLSIPFFVYYFYDIKKMHISISKNKKIQFIVFSAKTFKVFTLFICLTFLSTKFYSMSKQSYFDSGSRLKKTNSINNKFTKGVYTTKRRSEIINELLVHLDTMVKPNDYMLVYDKVPMLHYLTETKPYAFNSWVWIYDNHTFSEKLRKAENTIKVYPLVVQQKFETIIHFSEPIPTYLSEDYDENTKLIHSYKPKNSKVMLDFLKKNEYNIVWSNAYFNIFKTEKTHN